MAEESMKDFEREINASVRKVYEGDIMSGTVIGISDDEVTLDLNYYAQGIIKSENLSNDPGFRATEQLKYGQKLSAKVIRVDDGRGNLELSIKEADDDLADHFVLADDHAAHIFYDPVGIFFNCQHNQIGPFPAK